MVALFKHCVGWLIKSLIITYLKRIETSYPEIRSVLCLEVIWSCVEASIVLVEVAIFSGLILLIDFLFLNVSPLEFKPIEVWLCVKVEWVIGITCWLGFLESWIAFFAVGVLIKILFIKVFFLLSIASMPFFLLLVFLLCLLLLSWKIMALVSFGVFVAIPTGMLWLFPIVFGVLGIKTRIMLIKVISWLKVTIEVFTCSLLLSLFLLSGWFKRIIRLIWIPVLRGISWGSSSSSEWICPLLWVQVLRLESVIDLLFIPIT